MDRSAKRDAWKDSCCGRKERRDILEGVLGAQGWVIYETLKDWESLKRVQLQTRSRTGTRRCAKMYTGHSHRCLKHGFPSAEHLESLIKCRFLPQWLVITPNYLYLFWEFPYQFKEQYKTEKVALHVGTLNIFRKVRIQNRVHSES